MAENFIREFDKLDGLSVMGIYGGAHTAIGGTARGTQSVPCMANQLHGRYGGTVVQYLSRGRQILPIRIIEFCILILF